MVTLNVYDLTLSSFIEGFNGVALKLLAGGAFHCAVEICGSEYSYGFTKNGSGIYVVPPRKDSEHRFRESVTLGVTSASRSEIQRAIKQFMRDWKGSDYDWSSCNCFTFAQAFAARLGVDPPPLWAGQLGLRLGVLVAPLDVAASGLASAFRACRAPGDDDQNQASNWLGTRCQSGAGNVLDSSFPGTLCGGLMRAAPEQVTAQSTRT
jgi:hypothetical protein